MISLNPEKKKSKVYTESHSHEHYHPHDVYSVAVAYKAQVELLAYSASFTLQDHYEQMKVTSQDKFRAVLTLYRRNKRKKVVCRGGSPWFLGCHLW